LVSRHMTKFNSAAKRKRYALLSLLSIISCLFVFSASVFVASQIKSDRIKSIIEQKVGESINKKISIDQIDFSLLSGLTIEANGIFIEDTQKGSFPFYIDKLSLELELLSLLKRKIVFKNITLYNPHATVLRTEKDRIHILGIPDIGLPSQDSKKVVYKIDNISIKNGYAKFIDKKISDPPTIIDFHNINLDLPNPSSDTLPFELYAMFNNGLDNNHTNLTASGTLSNITSKLDLSSLQFNTNIELFSLPYNRESSYLKEFTFLNKLPKEELQNGIRAKINFKKESDGTTKMSGEFKSEQAPLEIPHVYDEIPAFSKEALRCDITFDKNSIKISNFGLKLQDKDDNEKLKIANSFDENGKSYTKITARDLPIKDLKKYIPKKFIPDYLYELSNQIKIGGTFKIASSDSGNKEGSKAPEKLFDSLEFKDVVITNGDCLPPVKLSGMLEFNENEIVLKRVSGRLGNSRFFNSHGKILQNNPNPVFELSLMGDIDTEDIKHFKVGELAPHLFPALNEINKISGNAALKLRFTGNIKEPDSFKKEGWVKLNNVHLSLKKIEPELKNIRGKITITDNVGSFSSLDLEVDESEVGLSSGLLVYDKKNPFIQLTVDSQKMSLKSLFAALPLKKNPRTNIRGFTNSRVTIAGNPNDLTTLRVNGEAKLDNTIIRLKGFSEPIYVYHGDINFNADEAIIKNGVVKIGNTKINLYGKIQDFSKPKIELYVMSPYLEFSDLSTGFSGANNDLDFNRLMKNLTVKGQIKVDKVKYKNLYFQDVRSNIALHNGQLEIDDLKITSDEGHVINVNDKILTESMVLKGYLTTSNLNPDEFKNHLKGNIVFKLKKGYIRNTGFMSNLYSKVKADKTSKGNGLEKDVPKFPYNAISGNLNIDNGIVSTDNLLIYGKKINIATTGTIDLPQEMLDLKVKVLTSNTVERVFHQLSLVPKAHAEPSQKNLLAHIYEIKGPLNNPQVEKLPYHSVELTALKTFARILKLPVQAIQMPEKILSNNR